MKIENYTSMQDDRRGEFQLDENCPTRMAAWESQAPFHTFNHLLNNTDWTGYDDGSYRVWSGIVQGMIKPKIYMTIQRKTRRSKARSITRARLERQREELIFRIERVERALYIAEPRYDSVSVREAEFQIEEWEAELNEIKMEILRLQDRSLFACAIEDGLTQRQLWQWADNEESFDW